MWNVFIRLVPSCSSFHSIGIPFPFNLNQHSSLIYFSTTRDSKDILFCFCSAYKIYIHTLISLSHSVSPLFLSIYIQYLNSKTNKPKEWYLTKCKTPPVLLSSKVFALLIRYDNSSFIFSRHAFIKKNSTILTIPTRFDYAFIEDYSTILFMRANAKF